jgi:hypothetical protein
MRTYLAWWSSITALCLCAAAVVNVIVDPYSVYGLVDRRGLNHVKPHAGTHGEAAKMHMLVRAAPVALVLGNSRAEVGFDPEHAAWPQAMRPVFNAALPGTGPGTSLQFLRHALAVARQTGGPAPRLVVWGVDFMDFLPSPQSLPATTKSVIASEGGDLRTVTGRMQATLTLDALLDSLATVAAQRDPYSQHLTAQGFNPMRDYERIAAQEGYRALFRQRSESQVRTLVAWAALSPRPRVDQAEEFETVRQVMALCAQEGIELKIVLYPYHARLLHSVRLAGIWGEFEAWKTALVRTVDEESLRLGNQVPVWDFALFNSRMVEMVPRPGDRQSVLLGYWEAGHFKQALGDLVLARVLDAVAVDDEFGLQLSSLNVPAVLERQRQLADEHALRDTDAVSELTGIVNQARQAAAMRRRPAGHP